MFDCDFCFILFLYENYDSFYVVPRIYNLQVQHNFLK